MTLRFPSLHHMAHEASRTAARFPLTLMAAIACALLQNGLLHEKHPFDEPYLRLLEVTTLCLPLTLAGTLLAARLRLPRLIAAALVGFAPPLMLYTLYGSGSDDTQLAVRALQLSLAAHLLVAVAPYLRHDAPGFWEFNKRLFLRFFLALLYTGSLYIGLILAIKGTSLLFDIKFSTEIYFDLGAWMLFVFNTWFFLGGVPSTREELSELDGSFTFPSGLKKFVQYVLMPLTTIYLLLLYLYVVKIAVVQEWPKGTIVYLVSGVSCLGLFTMLLLFPLADRAGTSWVRVASRAFLGLMIPLLVLLELAIWLRVRDYGITEVRYFTIVLGLWTAFVCVGYLTKVARSPRFIPLSLLIVTLATLGGPIGAAAVAGRSQMARLKAYFSKYDMLGADDVAHASAELAKMSADDMREVTSIVSYLHSFHDRQALAHVLPAAANYPGDGAAVQKILASVGLSYVVDGPYRNHFIVSLNDHDVVLPLTGYDYGFDLRLDCYGPDSPCKTVARLAERSLLFRLNSKTHAVEVLDNGQGGPLTMMGSVILAPLFELRSETDGLNSGESQPIEKMTLSDTNARMDLKLIVTQLTWDKSSTGRSIKYVGAKALVRLK